MAVEIPILTNFGFGFLFCVKIRMRVTTIVVKTGMKVAKNFDGSITSLFASV